ncbi:MAG: right-handed parallel beta-helix repeat-containing protein [Nanoarchaeota archaeon]
MGGKMRRVLFILLLGLLVLVFAEGALACVTPTDGMVITENTTFCPGTYNLPKGIEIGADNVSLDCNGAVLEGEGSGNNGILDGRNNVVIKNCNIKDFLGGITLANPYSYYNKVYNNTISSCPYGIVVVDSMYNEISNNVIENATTYSFVLWEASNNVFVGNELKTSGIGFFIDSLSSNNSIRYNEVHDNIFGFDVKSQDAIIEFNSISDNLGYNFYNDQPANIVAPNNYWGTTNPAEIAAGIYDFYDDNSLGVVNFCPFLNAPYPDGNPVSCDADSTPPQITINLPVNESVVTENYTLLAVTTDETALCMFYGDEFALDIMFSEDGLAHSYNLTGLKDNYTYNVKVVCQDMHSNPAEAQVTFTTNFSEEAEAGPDITPPSVTILSPSDESRYFKEDVGITFAANVGDENLDTIIFKISNGEDYINLTDLIYEPKGLYWYGVIPAANFIDGTHTVQVIANDTYGNVNDSETTYFIIDSTIPAVAFAPPTPVSGSWLNTNFVLNTTITDELSPISVVTYRFENASDGKILGAASPLSNTAPDIWTVTVDVNINPDWGYPIPDGSYILRIWAGDGAGNYNAAETIIVNIDKTPPEIIGFACADVNLNENQSCTYSNVTDNSQAFGGNVSVGNITAADTSTAGLKTVFLTAQDNTGNSATANASFNVIDNANNNPPPGNNQNSGGGGGGGGGGGYLAQCNDKKDNDKDGLIDYPNDPGCSSKSDNDETNPVVVKEESKEAVAEKEAAPAVKKTACAEDWVCTLWSDCADGKRTRECTEQNSCKTYQEKPKEIDFCAAEEVVAPENQPGVGRAAGPFEKIKTNWELALIVAATVLTILGVSGWKIKTFSAPAGGRNRNNDSKRNNDWNNDSVNNKRKKKG